MSGAVPNDVQNVKQLCLVTCNTVVAERSHCSSIVRAQAVAAPAAEPTEQVSTDIHGFKLERQQWVAEYNSTVLLYKHKKTGQHACSIV